MFSFNLYYSDGFFFEEVWLNKSQLSRRYYGSTMDCFYEHLCHTWSLDEDDPYTPGLYLQYLMKKRIHYRVEPIIHHSCTPGGYLIRYHINYRIHFDDPDALMYLILRYGKLDHEETQSL